jgi:hypothetical protein
MFSHRYIIKIYLGGCKEPLLEFSVDAQTIQIQGHSVKIDGVSLNFSQNHYIAVEKAV